VKQAKCVLLILLILALIFTSLPVMGLFDVQAKSKKSKAAKKIKLSGRASGTSAVVLKWNKIKSPQKGYAVFMDGKCIATFGKKTVSHVVSVAPGSSHSFQVKVWKKTTKKKKVNGKKKKVKVYQYSKGSNVISVSVPGPASVTPATDIPKPIQTTPVQQTYTITWKNWDNSVLKTDTVMAGATPTYTGPAPTRPATETKVYTFSGWKNMTTNKYVIEPAASDAVYKAQYTYKDISSEPTEQFTITWVNGSTVLATTTVDKGTVPTYNGAIPTKAEDSSNTYAFNGWTPAVVSATQNTTYKALFTATPKHSPASDDELTVDVGICYDFNGVNLYLGQTWNDTLENQIKNTSEDKTVWSFNRPVYQIRDKEVSATMTIYLFNTETYAPFLAVFVVNNQIECIMNNDSVMGSYHGTTYTRGMTPTDTPGVYQAPQTMPSGLLITGLSFLEVHYDSRPTSELNCLNESTMSYHCINAVRVANGRKTLKRSRYLDGRDLTTGEYLTWSGTLTSDDAPGITEPITLNNVRYGAQAWAETTSRSNKFGHDRKIATVGPCTYLYDDAVQTRAIYEATSDRYAYAEGENSCAGCWYGENVLLILGDSPPHWNALMASQYKSIGVGIYNEGACQQFSTSVIP